jgi:hypothetical protein
MQQYEAHEQQQRTTTASSRTTNHFNNYSSINNNNNVLYDSGMIIIDDDENPGLRSGGNNIRTTTNTMRSLFSTYNTTSIGTNQIDQEFPTLSATVPRTTTTNINANTGTLSNVDVASTLQTSYVQQQQQQQRDSEVVSLMTAAPSTTTSSDTNNKKVVLPKTKTLSKISKLIQPTNPIEQQKQWEARELARKKSAAAAATAMTSIERHESNVPSQVAIRTNIGISVANTPTTMTGPSIQQIERNRALADALGVQPSTLRNN